MFTSNPNDLLRTIQRVDEARIKDTNRLAKAINEMSVQQAKAQQREQIEAIKEIVTHTYSTGANYNNLIIVAGYVAFFTVWKSMKDDLSKIIVLSSCLSVAISVVLFIISSIHTMIANAAFTRKFFSKIKGDLPPTFVEDYKKEAQEQERHMFKTWLLLFIPTVLFGLIGGSLLIYGFGESLVLEIMRLIRG